MFVDGDGVEQHSALTECVTTRFEDSRPVREFRWSKQLSHCPGWWWSATTGRHVGYESWQERDALMLFDFDPAVVGIASQPFWLYWDGERRRRRHAPDYFVRRADGTAVVVDVRADDRIEPEDSEAFAATEEACVAVGWRFRRVGATDPVLAGNVRWLSRYRQPRCAGLERTVEGLLEAFTQPTPLWVGAVEVGDRLAVLPTLFHLMWRHDLVADLTTRLHPWTLVQRRPNGTSR